MIVQQCATTAVLSGGIAVRKAEIAALRAMREVFKIDDCEVNDYESTIVNR